MAAGIVVTWTEFSASPTAAYLCSMGKSKCQSLVRRDRSASKFPLSSVQQRLWFLDQLHPGTNSYNLHSEWEVRGELDADRLERAIKAVVARHEPLRSCFEVDNVSGLVWQRPSPACFALRRVDLAQHLEPGRTIQSEALSAETSMLSFDLNSEDLLIRGLLIRLTSESHILCLTIHHTAFDGMSLAPFVGFVIFRAFITTGTAGLFSV